MFVSHDDPEKRYKFYVNSALRFVFKRKIPVLGPVAVFWRLESGAGVQRLRLETVFGRPA